MTVMTEDDLQSGGGIGNEVILNDDHVHIPTSSVPENDYVNQYEVINDDLGSTTQQNADVRFRDDEGDGTLLDTQRRDAARKNEPQSVRRGRQRAARDKAHDEIMRLNARVAELEGRAPQIDQRLSAFDEQQAQFNANQARERVADLDRRIADAAHRATQARMQMSDAIVNQDADAMAAALEARDQAVIEGNRAQTARNTLVEGHPYGADEARRLGLAPVQQQNRAPQQQPQQQNRFVAPAERENVADFMARNPWYKGDQSDPDQKIVLVLDGMIMAEGLRPDTDEYWNELDRRMVRHLPHRFADAGETQGQRQASQATPPAKRAPNVAGMADRPVTLQKNQVVVGRDRKESLIQMGILDRDGRTVLDQNRYGRMLKQYHNFDSVNSGARQ